MFSLPRRGRQYIAVIIGLLLTLCVILYSSSNSGQWFKSPGKLMTGHTDLICADCHRPAKGSLRQQLQANVQHLIGQRKDAVDIQHQDVSNQHCLACHKRPKDNHPIYRFLEPRFKKAREELQAQHCVSCHQEHIGKRVSAEIDNCRSCHGKLKLKKDPLDISHHQLVTEKRFDTCLGCHDFHGNHKMKLAERLDDIYSKEKITDYFDDAPSPYSEEKQYKAKKRLDQYEEE
jgi:ribosomal protein L37AE/L43A